MRIDQTMLKQDLTTLYVMRDQVSFEMIDAKGKKFSQLQTKLEDIEEAIMLKESGYEPQEDQDEEA